jgi:RND superfamily putative drug exporter
MSGLAKLSIRRPRAALAIWSLAAIVLTLIGFGISSTLSPSVTVVPGTQSSRATQLANAQFGPAQLVPILLEGPKAQLDRQGPKLVTALSKRPHTRVLSAWDAGTASAGLRPSPTAAMIVVSVDRTEQNVVKYDQPQIEKLVSRNLSGGVKSYISGQPSIDRALKDASLNNLRKTELIAIGILFLLLLVGLRAPMAALIVAAVGAISTLSGFGEVALLGHVMHLDPIGVAAGTMTGLALGVAFALFILDRFHREELPEGKHPRDAATAAIRDLETTGKAVLVGGTVLVLALGLVAIVGPTELMVSVGTGVLACAAFATGGAVVVMPAALVLLGRRIDAFSFPAPASLARAWSRLVTGGNWVTRHAVYAGFAATALLAAIAVPAAALKSGPPDVSQLPAHANARIAFQEISRVMGPGWATPYNVIVLANGRPITTPALLASVNTFQARIAKSNSVASVVGPGAINSTSTQLKAFGPSLAKSAKISDQSKKDLVTLINGLGQAGSGSAKLQAGLAAAAAGAGQAYSGSGALYAGSGQLHSGLSTALSGAQSLKDGAGQALGGAEQLLAGLGQAHTGAGQSVVALQGIASLTAGASSEIAGVQGRVHGAAADVNAALSSLESMSSGKSDPRYGAVASDLRSASNAVAGLSSQVDTAAGTASQANALAGPVAKQAPALVSGLKQLYDGAGALQAGIAQIRNGNGALSSGLGELTSGASQLQAGLAQLTSGTGQLASGLAAAPGGAGALVSGLGQMQAAVIKSRGQIPSTKDLEKLQKQSPGLFNSGYFVLAAVEGAQRSDRNAATFTINLLKGGTAGQIVVVSKYAANDPRTEALRTSLARLGASFAKQNNAQVAIGGPAGNLGDLTSVTRSRIWLDVAVLALALALVLAIALRAVLLPIVTTAFSLLVAAATFGVVQLLFGGSDPLLGGPGYLDPISIISIFTVAFGITVMFSTMLLMRTREEYVADGTGRQAVRTGLRETAAAGTGAGIVMLAAVIPFATTDLINVRELGVGVAVAIALDVVLVRPVLLPAAEAVLGRLGWWPTSAPRDSEAPTSRPKARRLPRPHLPQRGPRAAH